MNDEEILTSRLEDLSRRAYERNYAVFSDFLNLEEISKLSSLLLPSKHTLFGGYDGAERCVAGFGDDIKDCDFPIVCVEISPLQQKFADKLSHRDFLGALMNTGINRNTLGDIIINDNTGYLFCLKSISEYVTDNLTRIKHTTVSCKIIDALPDCAKKAPEDRELIVPSMRADAVISALYHLSRNDAKTLFSQDKVFVNHRQIASGSHILKDGDTVSVRGFGKFTVREQLRSTKKERLVIRIEVYV
ncbi:MAG: hypothetical protein IKF64_09080 [Eubacterium sp.]|nr:hypothetical protein [Eubacterium sp.]